MTDILCVNERQRGNRVLQAIRNVTWEYKSDIVPDYVLGNFTCGFFLTINYHLLHPNYIQGRMREIGKSFKLRILLLLVDTDDSVRAINELDKICFAHDFTLIISWSVLEVARYLETFKAYENKPSSSIQEREETEFIPLITNVLTNVKSVNKTDVITLLESFDNFKGICSATEEQLMMCPGFGDKKVKRLFQSLHEPFNINKKKVKHSANDKDKK